MDFFNIAHAQTAGTNNSPDTATDLVGFVTKFINDTLVYVIFALAFLFFLFGVFKYFFGSGKNAEENRREGGKFILWSIIAFAVMISVWGLVNLLVNTFGFNNQARPDLPCFEGNDCNRAPGTGGGSGTHGT